MFALILAVAPAFAAEPAPPEKGKGKGEAKAADEARAIESRNLLEEVLMARLTRELALNEEQTVLMVRHLAEFRDKMAGLRRERMVLARELRQAVREGKDEAAIGELLEAVVAHEEKAAVARREIVDFDGFELTTWQKAKLYLFIVDFEGDMRRLLKQAQERRAGRAPRAGENRNQPPAEDGVTTPSTEPAPESAPATEEALPENALPEE
jgi:hypothetical protein